MTNAKRRSGVCAELCITISGASSAMNAAPREKLQID
jgi:hypothetical protein